MDNFFDKNSMHRNITGLAALLLSATVSSAVAAQTSFSSLGVEDYCTISESTPKGVKDMTPLNDGVTYAAVSDDGGSIEVYSYKTGQRVSTLFSLSGVKGDVKIDSFDGYTLSANERKILLWNEKREIYRNSFTAEFYVYDVMRSTLQRVSTGGPQRCAVMSHDGRSVAYMRDNNIYISNLDYGTDKAITSDGRRNEVINGVPDWAYEEEFGMDVAMCWSGDDSILAFIRFDESRVPVYSFDQYKSYCEENPLSDAYPEGYSYKYPLAGYPNSEVQVFAYNIDNGTTKKMDLDIASDDYVPCMRFDGNGVNLMVMVLNHDQNRLRLYRVNPASTVSHLLLTETSNAWLSPAAYKMTSFGEKNFLFGSERSGYRHLYLYDYNGNLVRPLTSGNWNVTNYYGQDPRTGAHYMQTTYSGPVYRDICCVSGKGDVTLLSSKKGYETAAFSKNFSYYLSNYSNCQTPPVYTIRTNKGKKVVTLEDNAEYAAKYASAPKRELFRTKNAAGEEMDAYMIKPSDFDASRKYPVVMYQYNGPDSQEVLDRWRMEGVYYLASQGYIIGCVDGRGTGNRSRTWANAVYKDLGRFETEDQLAGAGYFASLPYVDSSRMACFGWSYGGYMTLMEMTAKGSPFKAGIAMAPVTDWRFYDSIYTERYMQTPDSNEKGYAASSALERTQDLKGRLLIMSGTSDDNVHYYNTLKFCSKLNYEGKIFDMMSFAGFEHSLRMCNARAMLYRKIADFLSKEL